MADFSTAGFDVLRYEPGNPLFPTLPDGVDSLHVVDYGDAAEFAFAGRAVQRPRLIFSAAPNLDAQEISGWYTDETWRIPSAVDFGSIASPVRRTIALTNTRRDAITADSIALPTGVSLISPTLPATIEAFASVILTVEAATTGAAVFDEVATIATSAGDITVRMTGRRVFTIEVVPERPIRESLRFATSLIRSSNATEQAMSLATTPSSEVDYLVRFSDDLARARFRNLMIGIDIALIVALPKWFEAREVTQAVLASSTAIFIDTGFASYEVDGPISIFLPSGTFVRANVASIQADRLILANNIGTDIPLGSLVMPNGLGYIQQFPRYSTYPVGAQDAAFGVVFNREPDWGATLPASFPVFGGLAVLEHANEFESRDTRGNLVVIDDVLDSQISNRNARNTHPLGIEDQAFEHLVQSRDDAWSWRRFLHHVRGSAIEFLVPTFTDDLPGVTTTTANTFDVGNTGLVEFLGATPSGPRGALRFDYGDGTIEYRKITNVVDNGATEQVTVDAALIDGQPMISFLKRARILGDTASLTWSRPDEMVVRFRYRTVQE